MRGNKVTVLVPAATANLGPAFDCLGMALDIWNRIHVEAGKGPEVRIQGEGAEKLPTGKTNLVYRSALHLFDNVGVNPPPLYIECHNLIPLERGLGSSAAAIVGGLMAANHLANQTLSREQLLLLAEELEGHPDNVTPALLGGAQIVVQGEAELLTSPVEISSNLKAVLYVPEDTIGTKEARAVLPSKVSREDAIYNMGRVALLVNALAGGRQQDLRVGTQDRLHQPYRVKLFPAMKVIIQAALNAGALGAFVSGSGPAVLALTSGQEMTVAYEMAEAARKANATGEIRITSPTTKGAHILEITNEG